MDRQVIAEKLESLRRSIKRVEDKRPPSAEVLLVDVDAQDILSVNLTRAVQICVDVGAHLLAQTGAPAPDTMGQTFDRLVDAGIIDPALGERISPLSRIPAPAAFGLLSIKRPSASATSRCIVTKKSTGALSTPSPARGWWIFWNMRAPSTRSWVADLLILGNKHIHRFSCRSHADSARWGHYESQ